MAKFFKGLAITLLILIFLAGLTVLGGYIYFRSKFGIDVFNTIRQVNALNSPVNESSLCPEAFTGDDKATTATLVNSSANGFITYSEADGYSVDYNAPSGTIDGGIKLTGRQTGALADIIIGSKTDGKINVGGKNLDFSLKQVTFSEVRSYNATVSTVIGLDISPVKAGMNDFLASMVKKNIPDRLYVSSAVRILKGEQPFAYTVAHRSIALNNLSAGDTEDIFRALNAVAGSDSAKVLNEKIGGIVADCLIGNEESRGAAYGMKNLGAVDYAFTEEGGTAYFTIVAEELEPIVPEGHEHTMTHVDATPTCSGEGVVEHWHCAGCNFDFADEAGETIIEDLSAGAPAHLPETKHDQTQHWSACKLCGTQLGEKRAHGDAEYIKTADRHYKICPECNAEYASGEHTSDKVCADCGYVTDLTLKCASDYGYNYLCTLSDGASYQTFYERLDDVALAFHDSDSTAKSVTVNGKVNYYAGKAAYANLGLNINQAMSVWMVYCADHPLYYWIAKNIVYNKADGDLSLCVDAEYINGSTRKAQNAEIYSAIGGYLNAVSTETSAYRIALAFHDIMIADIEYAYDSSGNAESANWAHSIAGVFSDKKSAVCEGYAKAFSLLLNACDVENAYVTGSSRGVGHAWNIVNLDGGWYWYDLTWDDQPKIDDGIIYNYMCGTDLAFNDHTVGETGNMSSPTTFQYALPQAATVAYNTAALEYGETFTLGGFTYEVCGYNKAMLSGAGAAAGNVVLTDKVTYGGREYTLTKIGNSAFKNNRLVISLTVPQSVTVIYNFAFDGCALLYSVTFADKEGWTRSVSSDNSSAVSAAQLEDTSAAATLLKQFYRSGSSYYQYVWVKG